jgi:hypothetical protein
MHEHLGNLFSSLIKVSVVALFVLLLVPTLVYQFGGNTEKEQISNLIKQTPAKGLIAGTYDYYPSHLTHDDVLIYEKKFTDKNGQEYTGAVIEVRKPVAFATPADTGSMQPMFGAGNTLIQEVVNKDTTLYTGDIIVYEDGGKLIVHQIVGELDGCYITKGMNNMAPDSLCVKHDMVKYRLLFSIPTN